MSSWLSNILPGVKNKNRAGSERSMPEGVWGKCTQCGTPVYVPDAEKNRWVCPSCDYHERISAEHRAQILFDETPVAEELFSAVRSVDMLKFNDGIPYEERLKKAQKGDVRREAVRVYRGDIKTNSVIAAIFDFTFMGGSMGVVAGERFTRAAEMAAQENIPLLTFSASGGARMQEGMSSLLQMSKTTAILSSLSTLCVPHISVLTDPTTGGVAASFAMIGDIVIAEPNALIGFAGPRVIQETVREKLPDGFQRSEFLLQQGAIDMIWDRREMRDKFGELLPLLTNGRT